MQHETARRDGEARERVQQRDEHGHVRTANGKHEGDTECEGQDEDDDDEPVGAADADGHREAEHGDSDDAVKELLARVGDRASGHELLELGKGHAASGERDAADHDAEKDLDDLVDRQRADRGPEESGECDEGRGATTAAVEGRHHLGHRGHLDQTCGGDCDDRPYHHGPDDE